MISYGHFSFYFYQYNKHSNTFFVTILLESKNVDGATAEDIRIRFYCEPYSFFKYYY